LSEGRVTLKTDGRVATVCFDRPRAHNAITWAMYDQLGTICCQLSESPDIGVVLLRGAGAKSFVSGTDIGQFTEITDGAAGVAYEERINACVGRLEQLPQPTLALVDGWAAGSGLVLAAACDFRLASPQARFGVPIARTIGNCLSPANTRRLIAGFGMARAKRLLMMGDMIGATEAEQCGFVLEVVEPDALDDRASELAATLLANAPLTVQASKEMMRRILHDEEADGSTDLITAVYGSQDFQTGVRAFMSKSAPKWQGQ